VVQNPTTSLDADVAATKQVIAAQTGPVVLVGHSYGGDGLLSMVDLGEIVLSLSQPDVAHPTRSGNWVQTGLQMDERTRDLALFNLGIDTKLRACDLTAFRIMPWQ